MPELLRSTGIDGNGRLRTYTEYSCNECGLISKERNDKFKHRKGLCKDCLFKNKSKEYVKNADLELVGANIMYDRFNKRYAKKGLHCNIKGKELLNLLKANCHYCNEEPSNEMNYKQKYFSYTFKYNGLDRIDSSKGYIKGNVVTCCKKCNLAKSDLSYKEFINHIKKIYKNLCQ